MSDQTKTAEDETIKAAVNCEARLLGCIFGDKAAQNILHDPSVRKAITIRNGRAYGAAEAVAEFRTQFPEAFTGRPPGGTPPLSAAQPKPRPAPTSPPGGATARPRPETREEVANAKRGLRASNEFRSIAGRPKGRM